jgi:hypothetical protein
MASGRVLRPLRGSLERQRQRIFRAIFRPDCSNEWNQKELQVRVSKSAIEAGGVPVESLRGVFPPEEGGPH